MILITSSGPVGVKYMVDGLGALPKYDSGVFKGLAIASAYCFPKSVKYEQNLFYIITLEMIQENRRRPLIHTHPILMLHNLDILSTGK